MPNDDPRQEEDCRLGEDRNIGKIKANRFLVRIALPRAAVGRRSAADMQKFQSRHLLFFFMGDNKQKAHITLCGVGGSFQRMKFVRLSRHGYLKNSKFKRDNSPANKERGKK